MPEYPKVAEHSAELAALVPGARLVVFDSRHPFSLTAEMVPVIEEFLAGLSPDASPAVPTSPTPEAGQTEKLSARELEVLRLVAAGKSNQQIADELVISRNTVLRHVNHIFTKTGTTNRVEATSYAHRHILV